MHYNMLFMKQVLPMLRSPTGEYPKPATSFIWLLTLSLGADEAAIDFDLLYDCLVSSIEEDESDEVSFFGLTFLLL